MKADWAFRIFDFDEDGKITASDIERVVRQLCGNEQFSRQELDKIIFHVIVRIFDFLIISEYFLNISGFTRSRKS